MAWTLAGGVQGEFVGYLAVTAITEGSAGNAINISGRMGSTRRYTGMAYVYLRYKLTGNSKKAESPFAQSITTRITIRGKAALCYDPRLDSTVAGGSGAHRADDQSTWAWDDDACRNPALALLFYLLGYQINGLLAVGKGIPPARIDLESFAVAANLCDELVTKIGGGTEPRYRCDGVWSEGDSPTNVIDMLKATMSADLDDIDGKLRLTVFHDDLATPVADFVDDDVLDAFDWDPADDLTSSFNVVRGTFTDPSDTSLYQPIDYPQVEETSPDGIDRIDTFNLPMVQSAGQAQRLAQMRQMRQKFGGTFTADFQATAWKVEKNSVIRLSFGPRGWVNKLFRVAAMDIRVDGVVPLVLREESSLIYGAPSLVAAVGPVSSTPYDPTLNPWLQQLNATAQIQVTPSRSFAADYGGTVQSGLLPDYIMPLVTIAGDDLRIDDGTTYSISANGVTATVNNTTGDANKGRIEITAVDALQGYIDLTVTIGGIVYPARRIVVEKRTGLPSGFGGSGSKIASDNAFAAISGTSFAAITDTLTVTVASGESLYGTAPLDYMIEPFGSAASRTASAKWQYSPVGAGTWSDFGTAITGSASSEASDGTLTPGHGDFTQSVGSLTKADYDVRLVAAASATGRDLSPYGTATIEAKV